MSNESDSGSLALDWFASSSRRIDSLDAQQRQAADAKDRLRDELSTAAHYEGEGSAVKKRKPSNQEDDTPDTILEARSIPERQELLKALESLKRTHTDAAQQGLSPPTDSAQLARIAYATYALALQSLFDEAGRLQDSAWYWNSIEDEPWSAALYMLQTFPARLVLLGRESYRILKNATAQASTTATSGPPPLNKQTILATVRSFQKTPELLIGALWPHSMEAEHGLARQDDIVTASSMQGGGGAKALAGPLVLLKKARKLSPLSLTLHEARVKQDLLRARKDKVAEQLGMLTRTALTSQGGAEAFGASTSSPGTPLTAEAVEQHCRHLVAKLQEASDSEVRDGNDEALQATASSLAENLERLLKSSPLFGSTITSSFAPVGLGPPSRLSVIWPKLVLYPSLLLLSLRLASNNKEVIREALENGKETLKGFFKNWVVQPVKELLDTIRGGDVKDEGGIVTKEGRKADLESLERMVTAYAVEKGQISAADAQRAEELRRKVREGDLDIVMRAYEDQLKSPFKALTVGSLPRLLLIQVQKAKYDLAVAMSGIDHLLQSQALLFGAVGIAPAMGILWLGFKGAKWVVRGERAKDSSQQRARAWSSMRRIDRLLTRSVGGGNSSSSGSSSEAGDAALSALSYGRLLLELDSLRRIASEVLDEHSCSGAGRGKNSKNSKKRRRQRVHGGRHADDRLAEFLEDVRDLEGIAVSGSGSGGQVAEAEAAGQAQRKAAVERMWRCWGWLFTVTPARP